MFNTFLANVPILYPLWTPENQWFTGVFRGLKMGTIAINMLIISGSAYFVKDNFLILLASSQAAFTCSKSKLETLEKIANSVQSQP